MMSYLVLHLEKMGEIFEDVFYEALRIAKTNKCAVEFCYDGFNFRVRKGDKLEHKKTRYNHYLIGRAHDLEQELLKKEKNNDNCC